MKCHFRGNELAHGEETCQNWLTGSTIRGVTVHTFVIALADFDSFLVLRKASDDAETSTLN